jgi:uncharacterized membrane protein YkvA (DUF1232 family)
VPVQNVKKRARALKRQTYVLYFACRDPRTPWYAKVFAGAVVAYALSPIDLIPDFIPLLGYLDDLLIVPAGLALALRMVPKSVVEECRACADAAMDRSVGRYGAAFIIALWLLVAVLVVWLVANAMT